MNRISILFATLYVFSFTAAQAQSTQSKASADSKVKIEDVHPEPNKAPGEDVDEVITNKKMRAEAGSKSKYSIATAWNYKGGTINSPLDESRPNITAGANNTAKAYLQGEIDTKFAFDQRHSIFAGFGIRWITPLYGTSTPPGFDRKFDASDPNVSYRYVYKAMGFQNALSVGPTLYTSQDNRALGYVSDFSLAQNSMYEVGHTGLSIGFSAIGEFQTFDHGDGIAANGQSYFSQQADIRLGFIPVLEYQITDRLNFRTLTGAYFEHHRSFDPWTMQKNKVYQSFGLGISVTRDIFLYPNVQFIPDQLRPAQTNVALNANINIF